MTTLGKRLSYLEAERFDRDAERLRKESEMQSQLHLPLPDECTDEERSDCLVLLIDAIEKGRELDHESASAFLMEFVQHVDTLHEKYK